MSVLAQAAIPQTSLERTAVRIVEQGFTDAEKLQVRTNLGVVASGALIPPRVTAIAFASTITPNADNTDIANVGTLTADITIANPTGTPVDGQDLQFRLAEDGTGGWVITWGNGYAFGTDVTLALIPTTASAKWEMIFTWNATEVKWRCRGIARGF